ncbi:type II secretion system protein [Vibrio crassostreae]|uniref:type II secretion system protein n=1 Tax=Vibrio crassostreae TaxID=246167 RepID=UPI001B3008CF|nr:type II secretion system protein [Vibrio crassostreae]
MIDGQDKGVGETVLGDVTIPLLNGYPSVDGGDSFFELNRQVQAWLDIDSVGKDEIISNPNAAPFFVDKSSTLNQVYIFFSNAPTSGNRTEYGCQVRYQNSDAEGYSVRVLTSEC